ncbi:NADH:flavin oxidoreductase [Nocardia arthritidis]|uniref:NADH:flavin oxidoreductase n=1 Tax=Nocardia arthritidis TaxID=228602 RepID=UPI0007A44CF7|nr:NADH:flavin oxidoreductase [Nocardia arthritidis]
MTASSAASAARPDPLAPVSLGPVRLRNRIIKSATFEGVTTDALVTDALIDFHVAVGEGGVGMTTVAYLAVSPEGRTEKDQIYWRPEALPGLRKLTDAVHATGAAISAQIGHAGPVANSRSTGLPSLAPSTRPNPLSMSLDRAATEDDIQRIIDAHAQATRYAIEVGFDAVEVHLGHNYLASSFLSPNINRRKDNWGGSLANRARLARRVLQAVGEAADGRIAVLAKMNMADGVPGGLWLDESLVVAQMIERDGYVDALELTGGSSLLNPMYLFRGEVPVREMAETQRGLVKLGMKMFGNMVFRHYPYEPLYFRDYARQFRDELDMPLVLLGGITDLAGMNAAMDDGFEFVAMARALLREPDLINRIQSESAKQSLCIHCNLCAASIFTGTRCPLAATSRRGSDAAAHPVALPS